MKLAFITPTSYLDKYASQGDFFLALAHLVDDKGQNEYSRFHRRKAQEGYEVICDNGLFEGKQVSPEDLILRARLIGAQTVCAPDVLYNSTETIKQFKQFIKLKQDMGGVFNVMGIPQADNPTDWWNCFRFFDLSKECHLIGLSVLSIPKAFDRAAGPRKEYITGSRMYLIKQLTNHQILLGRKLTPIHLLGLGESMSDVSLANRLLSETIVSNDSSSCFVHGSKRITYSAFGALKGGKDMEKLDFSAQNVDNEVCIQTNITIARKVANYDFGRKISS